VDARLTARQQQRRPAWRYVWRRKAATECRGAARFTKGVAACPRVAGAALLNANIALLACTVATCGTCACHVRHVPSDTSRPTYPADDVTCQQLLQVAGEAALQQAAAHATAQPPSRTRSARSVLAAILVHTAADGLTVGVAHMSTSIRLAVTIGMAMVLHKGPVAFGLISFFLAQAARKQASTRRGARACAGLHGH
jgi:zinc transporter ZupT